MFFPIAKSYPKGSLAIGIVYLNDLSKHEVGRSYSPEVIKTVGELGSPPQIPIISNSCPGALTPYLQG
jgi:hypothetical protein